MRKQVQLCLCVLALGCSPAAEIEPAYRLTGEIAGAGDGEVRLLAAGAYLGYTFEEIASAPMAAGRFEFSGRLDAPQMLWVQPGDDAPRLPVFLGHDEAVLEAKLEQPESVQVTGAPLNDLHNELLRQVAVLDQRLGELEEESAAARQAGDREAALRWESLRESTEARRKERLRAFVLTHAESPVAVYVALRYLSTKMDLDELEPMVEALTAAGSTSPYFPPLRERIESLRSTAVGRPAPEFALPDPQGRKVSLASYAGKVVLIDFWASWCGPCRAQNPELIRLYERYQDRGFEILGVGLELAREPWLAAIEADGLPWTQLSDIKGFGTSPARAFAVRSIPDNVLLARDGTILARHVETDRLGRLLAVLFAS